MADAFGQRYFQKIGEHDNAHNARKIGKGLSGRQLAIYHHYAGDADPEEKGKGVDGVDEKAFEPECQPGACAGNEGSWGELLAGAHQQRREAEDHEQNAARYTQTQHEDAPGHKVFDIRQAVINAENEQRIADPNTQAYHCAGAQAFFNTRLYQCKKNGTREQAQHQPHLHPLL